MITPRIHMELGVGSDELGAEANYGAGLSVESVVGADLSPRIIDHARLARTSTMTAPTAFVATSVRFSCGIAFVTHNSATPVSTMSRPREPSLRERMSPGAEGAGALRARRPWRHRGGTRRQRLRTRCESVV